MYIYLFIYLFIGTFTYLFMYLFTSIYISFRCILSPNAPEFDRLITAAKLYYSKILIQKTEETKTSSQEEGSKKGEINLISVENMLIEEHSESKKILRKPEECSSEQVRAILKGLESLEKEEQVKYLSIALGNVVIIKKGKRLMFFTMSEY